MKNYMSPPSSARHLVVALGICISLVIGIGAGGCAVAEEEQVATELEAPAVAVASASAVQASTSPTPLAIQVVFQCFTPDGTPIGLPKSPLSACRAACPAPNFCVRCIFQNNAVECP